MASYMGSKAAMNFLGFYRQARGFSRSREGFPESIKGSPRGARGVFGAHMLTKRFSMMQFYGTSFHRVSTQQEGMSTPKWTFFVHQTSTR